MAFNRWTYYANKHEREARAYIARAREEREEGETYPGRVVELVKLARLTWRSARSMRALA